MKKAIGEKIRQTRVIKNYSQENVAMELGLSVGAYSNIERGKTDLTITRLFEIAKVLGTTVADLLAIGATENGNKTNGQYTGFFDPNELKELKEEINNIKKEMASLKKPKKKARKRS